MAEAIQARTLATRARLLSKAQEVISQSSYGEMRVEEVVKRAGVAKGTFFAHFKDKDALMDLLIGSEIDKYLDRLEAQQAPKDVQGLVKALVPLMEFMTRERYIFDMILRHSGAAAIEHIGPIAATFERSVTIIARWIEQGEYRKDADPSLLAEGVQAFMVQVMALKFCALHNTIPLAHGLTRYLDLWLPEQPLKPTLDPLWN